MLSDSDVLLLLSLLNTIDNPLSDVDITSVLCSPLFGFKLEELIHIRREYPDMSVYVSLKMFSDEHSMKKGIYFFEKLDEYRKYSRSHPVDELIWYIFCDTGILYMPGDDEEYRIKKRRSLMYIYDYARNYSHGASRSLYMFVKDIEDMLAQKVTLKSDFSDGDDNYVKIESIHKSKGLQYPVCFIANNDKKFTRLDENDKFCINEKFGVGVKLATNNGIARYDTPFRQSLTWQIRKNAMAEELRILYVALTRAEEKLYICHTPKNENDLCIPEFIFRDKLFVSQNAI